MWLSSRGSAQQLQHIGWGVFHLFGLGQGGMAMVVFDLILLLPEFPLLSVFLWQHSNWWGKTDGGGGIWSWINGQTALFMIKLKWLRVVTVPSCATDLATFTKHSWANCKSAKSWITAAWPTSSNAGDGCSCASCCRVWWPDRMFFQRF